MAWLPNGKQVLTGGCDRTARLWDAVSGALIFAFTNIAYSDSVCVSFISVSPDGALALIGDGYNARLYDLAQHKFLRNVGKHGIGITAALFAPDGKQVLTAGTDQAPASCLKDCASARLWDLESGTMIRQFTHLLPVRSLAFSPDGSMLLTGSYDNEVRLWNTATGDLLHTYSGHTGYVMSVAFSPDATRLASGSWDTTARIWDLATGAVLHTFAQPQKVNAVAFDASGAHLAVSAGDNTYVWDALHGGLVAAVGHSGEVHAAVYAPDATRLLTGGYDSTAKLWQLK